MTALEFNQCVDLYADGLYRFLLKNLKDADMANDVVQDTFEKVWLKVSQVEFKSAKSYLFKVGYHAMIDKIRKEQRSVQLEEQHEDLVQTEGYYSDLKSIMEKALATLSDIQRHVVLLRDYEGYSYDEIGSITGLNENQVKVYIYRARISMKNYLGSIDNLV